jgi:4-amino-4-deoxy-L-arabinose transferase-like glycosyltransferase
MRGFVKTRSVARPTQLAIFISILAIAMRFFLIDQPYIDNWSWRQSDVAAIARNFYQNGFHFGKPQIDWAGDTPGYVGTEFPILPFVAAICYKIFGVHEWIGRIQGVVLFAASLPFFFLLVRDLLGATAAAWALFFYSFAPLNLFTGREFMPDVPSLSLALIGLYFFLRWIDQERLTTLLASAVCVSLSILIKLPSVLIGVPLFYLTIGRVRDRRILSRHSSDGHPPSWNYGATSRPPLQFLILFAVIALLPSAIWYWHAHLIAEKFYPYHFFGAGGIRIMSAGWYGKIAKQITTSSLTPVLFALAAAGAFVTRTCPERQSNGSIKRVRIFHWWLAAMIVFIVVVGYGSRHQWYQLPLVPIAAALAGGTCASLASKVPKRSVRITLSTLLAGSFSILAFHYVRPFYQPSAAELRDLGLELRRTTPQNSLIVAADNGDPTIFYYAERKGWHFLEKNGIYDGDPGDNQQLIVDLEQLRGRGATHLVFISSTFWWLDYYHEFAEHFANSTMPLGATSEFRIYKLNLAKK